MLFECRHAADDPLVFEMWHLPFDGFLSFRAGGMDELADMVEDGLRKVRRLGDVSVHARVFRWHDLSMENYRAFFNEDSAASHQFRMLVYGAVTTR